MPVGKSVESNSASEKLKPSRQGSGKKPKPPPKPKPPKVKNEEIIHKTSPSLKKPDKPPPPSKPGSLKGNRNLATKVDLHKEGETRNQNTSPVSNSHVDTKDETMESIQSVNNRVNATGSLNRSASARLWPSEKAEGESKRRSASFRTEHEVVSGTQYSTDPHQTAKTSSSDKKTKPSGPVAPPRPQPRSKSSFVNEKKTPARPTRPVPPPRPKPGKNIKTTNRKNIVNDSSNDRKATDERGQNYGISETREEPKLNKVEISDEQMIQRTDTDSDQSTCNAADDEKKIESGVLKVDNETHETENTTEVETVKSICETDVQKVESDGLKDLDKVVAVQESSVSDSFDNEPRVSVVFTSESEPSQENKSESVRNEDLPLPCVSSIGITDQDKIKSEFDQQKKPDAIVSTEYVIHSNEGVTPPIIVNEPECNVTQKESPVMQVSSSPGKRRKHMSAEDRELSKQGDYETVTLITSSKHSENVETPDDFTETDGNKKRSHSYENTPEFKRKSDEHSYENVPNSFQKDNQMEVQRINGQVASLPCTPTKSDTKLMNNVYDYVPSPSEGDQTEVLDIGKPMSIQPCTLTKSDVEVTNNLYGSIPSSYEGNQTEIQNNYKPVPLPPCTPTKSETKVTNNLYGNIQSSCEGIQTEIQNSNKPLPLPPPAPTKGAAEVTNTSYEYVSPPHKVLEDSTSGFELHPDDENADPDYENTKLSHRYSDSEDEIGDYVDIDKHVKLDNPSKNPDYTNHPNSNSIEQNDTYSTPVKTDNDYFKLPKSCPARLSGGPNRDQDQDGYLLPVEQQSDKPEEFRKSAGDVRRKLFGKEDQVKSHDEPDTSTQKKIRRPAPQPPSFEANTIVRNLRPWQQNQPKFQGNGDLSKRTTAPPEISSSTNSTAEPLDNNALYAAPMKNESSDELSNNTATEPLNNNAIYAAPIKRASLMSDEISASSDSYYKAPSGSITETDTEDNRISLISETLSHHDEYVDPDSLHSGSNRGSLMSDNASAPNNRISTVMDNEYAAPDAELNEHRQSIHSSRSSVSSSGSFSVKLSQTEEYVVMSDHSEESPPKKTAAEDGPDLPQRNHVNQKPKRPPPRPPPPRPTTLAKIDDSDNNDNFYEKIRSLKKDLGNLPSPRTDEEFSESDTESEGESKKDTKEAPEKTKSKLYYIAEEILTTERTFVGALQILCEEFGGAVKKMLEKDPKALPEGAFEQMFLNLEILYGFDVKFLKDLEDRMKSWEEHKRIGDIIRNYGPFLKMYTTYIKGYDHAIAAFQQNIQNMPKFAALVKEYEKDPKLKNLKLTSYMLKPIQRIPSYRLLLVDYIKHLPEDSTDHKDVSDGLQIVSEVADHINESMKEGEKFQEVLRIQSLIVNCKEIIKPGRYLIKEGLLNKFSRKEAQERMFFLFTDSLMYCTPVGHQYKLIQELPLAGMSVHVQESLDFATEFTIVSTKRSFNLSTRTSEERNDWIKALRGAIDEVTKKLVTFAVKLEHEDASSFLSGTKELGTIAPPWIPDGRCTMCMICTKGFTVYNRRHHCRACGKVVCGNCSSYEAPLEYMDFEASRVCESCYEQLYNTLVRDRDTDEKIENSENKTHKNLSRQISVGELQAKFHIVKTKKKKGRNDRRKSLPSKLTEVSAAEQGTNNSGYLRVKKGKNWKKFWFVLKEHVLYSYKASSDPAASDTLVVLGYEVKKIGNWDVDDLVFQLEHKGLKEPIVYKADNRNAAERWLQCLQNATELSLV